MRRRRPKATTAADTAIGARIRAQRLARRMTQIALADALGITFQQLQKYENGKNRVGAGRLQEVAKVLHVPLAALFGSDSAAAASRTENLAFLDSAGAMRLMRAYAALPTPRMKRALVVLAERIAGRSLDLPVTNA
jgi:transcriptional regulator with XRE-family HTH domain